MKHFDLKKQWHITGVDKEIGLVCFAQEVKKPPPPQKKPRVLRVVPDWAV